MVVFLFGNEQIFISQRKIENRTESKDKYEVNIKEHFDLTI
jgi:hypothetical protein